MSRPIDLMPVESRRRLARRTQRRRWVIAYTSTAATVALVAIGLQVRAASARAELDILLRQVELDNDQARRIESLRTEHDRVAASIERHNALAWPVEITDLLGVIAEAMPPSVALSGLTITPVLERDRGAQSGETIASISSITIELTGVAPSDLDIASLISGLETRSLFDRVAIDHSRSATIRGVEAREFGVTCQVNFHSRGERRIRPASASAQEGAR